MWLSASSVEHASAPVLNMSQDGIIPGASMTSTVTEITLTTILFGTHESRATSLGLILVLLLVALVVERELMRARGGPQSERWTRTLNVAIVPLLMAFAVIVVIRLLDITEFL
jgi:hypothetical protein